MAARAIGNDNERKYGFYDANVGVVEFSDTEKFKEYMTEFFSASGLNKAENYHLKSFHHIILLSSIRLFYWMVKNYRNIKRVIMMTP